MYLNADQPPCLKFMVSEADIRRQEERVKEVRDRLQRVMKGDPEAIQGERSSRTGQRSMFRKGIALGEEWEETISEILTHFI